VALVELEKHGITGLPKPLQIELVTMCKPLKNRKDCYQTFRDGFVDVECPVELLEYECSGANEVTLTATLKIDGKRKPVSGKGNGPIHAYLQALNSIYGNNFKLTSYTSVAAADRTRSADAEAICVISMAYGGKPWKFGVGMKSNTTHAALLAATAACNRALTDPSETDFHKMEIESMCSISAIIQRKEEKKEILGSGNGPVAAFIDGLRTYYPEAVELTLKDYCQSARYGAKEGRDSEAVCTIACTLNNGKKKQYGVGLDVNTNVASAKAILSSMSLLLS